MILAMAIWLLIWLLIFLWANNRIDNKRMFANAEMQIENVTVLIAMRNEVSNIESCLNALDQSEGIALPLQVILVDDNSNDQSSEWVEAHLNRWPNLKIQILPSSGQGKKMALTKGISCIPKETDYLYLTDADCVVGARTIYSMVQSARLNNESVVYGSVLFIGESSLEQLLSYENLNNQCFSEALVKGHLPILVNGGNTLLPAKHISKYTSSLNSDSASGDDVFNALQLRAGEYAGNFGYDQSVTTSAPHSLKELISQRVRWASKSKMYPNAFSKAVAPTFFLLALSYLIVITALFFSGNIWIAVSAVGLKFLIEYSFHSHWFRKYNQQFSVIRALEVSVLHPFYVIWVGLATKFKSGFDWKGRHYEI